MEKDLLIEYFAKFVQNELNKCKNGKTTSKTIHFAPILPSFFNSVLLPYVFDSFKPAEELDELFGENWGSVVEKIYQYKGTDKESEEINGYIEVDSFKITYNVEELKFTIVLRLSKYNHLKKLQNKQW